MHFIKRLLFTDLRIHIQTVKRRKIIPINKIKFCCHIHISIQVNITVGRMVISSVEFQELFIGQLRNIIRITTGLTTIGDIRKQRVHDISFQHIIRRRKCPFHLIVNNTIISQWTFWLLQMVAPSFLTEDFFFFVNIWIKYSIQIHMHQILKILIIATCYRITGFIRISHCI